MAVFVSVWCFGAISGAHINPAVTVGLAAAGDFPWDQSLAFIAAQMFGAILGAVLVYVIHYDHYQACDSPDDVLGTFSTSPGIRNYPLNLLCEAAGTFVLVLAILMAVEPELEFADPLAGEVTTELPTKVGLGALGALPVGLLVLAIGLCLGGPTGYAINPARDLGPRIAHALLPIRGKRDSDWQYAMVPVVGPLLGGLLAAIFLKVFV
jgi:glycerol uptake facilitator protein